MASELMAYVGHHDDAPGVFNRWSVDTHLDDETVSYEVQIHTVMVMDSINAARVALDAQIVFARSRGFCITKVDPDHLL